MIRNVDVSLKDLAGVPLYAALDMQQLLAATTKLTDEQRTALRDLVQPCMTSRTPTTRMAASVEESPPLTSAPATLPPSTGTEMSDGVSQCAEDTTSGVAADGSDTPHPTAG